MSLELCLFMVFLWKSIMIVVAFSPLDSGKASRMLWELISHLAQISIPSQVERVNQILEDMLRSCVISFGKNWEKSLPFVEFAYNNSFQSSLNMAPFELLYGRRCRTPLNWSETGERQFFGPDMIKEAEEQVRIVRDQLKAAQ